VSGPAGAASVLPGDGTAAAYVLACGGVRGYGQAGRTVGAMAGQDMKRLLVVHHTTSPSLESMLAAVLDGTRAEGIVGVEVEVRPALAATASDVLAADGFVLGTPANMGYMSGALKHFFDQVYYPCLTAKAGAPYALYVHGNLDVEGAQRSVAAIVAGLRWERVAADVTVVGTPTKEQQRECWELGAIVAATLAQ